MRKIHLLRQNRSEKVSQVYRSEPITTDSPVYGKILSPLVWLHADFGAPHVLCWYTVYRTLYQNLRSSSFVLFFLPKKPPDDAINTLVLISIRYLVNLGSDPRSSKFISKWDINGQCKNKSYRLGHNYQIFVLWHKLCTLKLRRSFSLLCWNM